MKTYRNALVLALTLAFLTAFTGLASAQGHGMRGQGMMGGGMGAMSPEQQATMQKLHTEHAAATAELRKQIFAKESELNAQIYAEKTDEAKVEALTKDIGALNAKLYAERVKLHRQMAKEGIMPMAGSGCGMMAGKGGMKMHGGGMGMGMGGMNCPMMNGMNADNGTAAPAPAPADHGAHAPAQQ
jgi:zinc resistance-associated protein